MNRLSKETSPYLLQHAHNPVDWYPWSEEAFSKARAEDKPILVSIGYSTCHWCHVMERESFEDKIIAKFMNENFINIKVDREERPDVDAIYMEALQLMTGSGGWPLNCFLMPDGRPFYGGTYFPPRPAHGRNSWSQILMGIQKSYQERREQVEKQANQLLSAIGKPVNFSNQIVPVAEIEKVVDYPFIQRVFQALRDKFDTKEGGFGSAPKFPSTMAIQFLLAFHYHTKNESAKRHVLFSLDKMIKAGIYDQIGGGFARYATDRAWRIPHFEKMLYDNALLVQILSQAYALTKSDTYLDALTETLTYIEREMWQPQGGFYAAQDADSEGVEGKYYVWSKTEINQILGDDAAFYCQFYNIIEKGNWEGVNILYRDESYKAFAKDNGMTTATWKSKVKEMNQKLLSARQNRIPPGLDDKLLLDWNALMCTGYAKAFQATQNAHYKDIALQNMHFLLENFSSHEEEWRLYHTYKNGIKKYGAFIDDYAYLIEALIAIYEITFDTDWLTKAQGYTDFVITQFYDEKGKAFYFTHKDQKDIIVRQKEIYDNATPSGNSTMVRNLQALTLYFGEPKYDELAKSVLLAHLPLLEKYPQSFAKWAEAALSVVFPPLEIAVVGEQALTKAKDIQGRFLPHKVIMASLKENAKFPLLENKKPQAQTYIYVCQDYQCQEPILDFDDYID